MSEDVTELNGIIRLMVDIEHNHVDVMQFFQNQAKVDPLPDDLSMDPLYAIMAEFKAGESPEFVRGLAAGFMIGGILHPDKGLPVAGMMACLQFLNQVGIKIMDGRPT